LAPGLIQVVRKKAAFFRVQSRRLSDPFESLNSFLMQSAEKLERL